VLGNWGVSTDRGYAPTRAEAMAVFKLAWEPMLGGVGLSGSQRSVVTCAYLGHTVLPVCWPT